MISWRHIAFSLALACPLSVPVSEASIPEEDYDPEVVSEEGAVFGRLRHLEGGLTMRRGEEILGEPGLNEPVIPGDVVTTGAGGRAEIQLADGSFVWLDAGSELVFQSLPDGRGVENTTILQLAGGSLVVEALGMESGDKRFQIDTDDASVFLLSDGSFRIDAEPAVTTVRSRRGTAEVMALDASAMLHSGERVSVRAGEMPDEPRVVNTRSGDQFDAWVAMRDEALVHHQAGEAAEVPVEALPEPVRPYAAELSYYGSWSNYPAYGWAWHPTGMQVGWSPYVYGRWAWAPHGGMVWASYDPWGWAPYHYGRWEFAVGFGWLWIPGYSFAGAHVAWSVSPGYFGWCPLGYYNYPVYHHGVRVAHHRNPWVYVRADHIYHRRVNTVMVRDDTVVRDIHRRAVVVRGQPRISPRRAADAPAFTRELHRKFASRPDLQIREPQQGTRVPFRDQERKAARLNPRTEARRPITAAAGRAPGRQQPVSNPANSTPRSRLTTTREMTVREQTGRLFERRTAGTSGPAAGSATRQGPAPRATSSTPRQGPAPRATSSTPRQGPAPRATSSTPRQGPAPRATSSTPRQGPAPRATRSPGASAPPKATAAPSTPAPRQVKPGAAARPRSGSAPERVIPRIIPRSQSARPAPARPSGSTPSASQGASRSAAPKATRSGGSSSGKGHGQKGDSGGKGKGGKN